MKHLSMAMAMLVACGSKGDPNKEAEKAKEKTKEEHANDVKANPVGKEPVGACTGLEGGTLCSEYWGRLATPDFVKQNCDAASGKVAAACPKDNAVARCVTEKGTASETHSVFYGPKMTKESAAKLCAAELRDP